MFARFDVVLKKALDIDQLREKLEAPRYLAPNDANVISGTLFAASSNAAVPYVVYSGTNGRYVVIVLWHTGESLEVIIEPNDVTIRRAADETWRALKRSLKAEKVKARLEGAYLVESTGVDLERGSVAFAKYVLSPFTLQSLMTATLTLIFAGILAIETSGSVTAFLLAGASAISVFAIGLLFGLRNYKRRKLVWETIR